MESVWEYVYHSDNVTASFPIYYKNFFQCFYLLSMSVSTLGQNAVLPGIVVLTEIPALCKTEALEF
jgi:hypothetical protein